MPQKNALLVYPKFGASFWSFKHALQYLGKKSSMPPLGLLHLAGMFPKHYNLRLVDMNVQPLTNTDIQWADVLFTSTMIVQRKSLDGVILHANCAGKPVVAGGPHPTSYWDEIKGVNHFILGEVEDTFPRFLQDFENDTAEHIYPAPLKRPAVTCTPMPRYDLINMRAYGSMLLQFSRGCPFDCEFCDITKLYGRVPRTKTNEQMLAEFDLLYSLGWRGSLFLVDDNFIGNRRDAMRLLKALIPWQAARDYPFELNTEASMNLVKYEELMDAMIRAGFTSVFVGIETPTPEALKITKKPQNVSADDPEFALHAIRTLQKKGFIVSGGFILGLDGETPKVFDLHIEFIQLAAVPMAMEGLLTVLKGTDLYFRMEREGRLRGDTTGNNLDTRLNFVPEMDEHILTAGYKRVLNAIYDRGLDNYFARCWTLLQHLDRSRAPRPMHTPLRPTEIMRFALASLRQLLSPQGPAYLRFLSRVITHHPDMLWEAFALTAKGYHLHKIMEQVTAVDDLRQYLTMTISSLHDAATRRIPETRERMEASARDIISRIRKDYQTIHPDFVPDVQEAICAFYAELGKIIPGSNLPHLMG
ncbi:MAG: B12-binding domain-containing radical SAM protein [Candidatus Sungbacteria bacterium]|nr:B12-binding domain-containing radical SAM protein [Candidatus Sungbacteria bacterium]